MSISRRGSRPITVDGVRFRWRIRKRPTANQRSGKCSLIVAVAAEEGDGPTLLVYAQSHPRNEASLRSYAVTPGHVARYVRAGLAAGWRPHEPGRQFVLDPRALAVDVNTCILPPGHRAVGPAELEALAAAPHRDHFELMQVPRASWSAGGAPWATGVVINGRDLAELVIEVESPLVEAELERRRAAGETRELSNFAGEYFGLSAGQYRNTLSNAAPGGELYGFVLADNPRWQKTTLMTCTCGINECWFLLVRISILDDVVVWSEFEQFHREWVYDLGPFVFDKADYMRKLA